MVQILFLLMTVINDFYLKKIYYNLCPIYMLTSWYMVVKLIDD